MSKRGQDGSVKGEEKPAQAENEPAVAAADDDDDDDDDLRPNPHKRAQQMQQRFCPYLDTINRHVIDFDFEKVCSVSNSHLNVYCCLVCGRFYQGRARNSPAYFHALEFSHHVFVKLASERVYCIPEGYEVLDASLNDIKYVLNPTYSAEQVSKLDKDMKFCRGLDGSEYIAGTVGLNNIKKTDYVNVVVQALTRVAPLRDFFMQPSNYATKYHTPLIACYGELVRKMWNPRNFKGHVSPHELLQAISVGSNRRYRFDVQSDPVDFLAWFINSIHISLGGTKAEGSSVVHEALQGKVRITTRVRSALAERTNPKTQNEFDGPGVEVKEAPFLFLTLDLPPVPLLKDDLQRNIIPQVPLVTILNKFDGVSVQEDMQGNRRRYQIVKLPRFLILHMKRFVKNTQQLVEKNITIVNFPVRNLDVKDICAPGAIREGESTRYNLIANICHEGKHDAGVYKIHVLHKPNDTWYEIQDLHLQEILPQMVAISESYIQIYERQQQ